MEKDLDSMLAEFSKKQKDWEEKQFEGKDERFREWFWYSDQIEKKMPLSLFPLLTIDTYKKSVDWREFKKKVPNIYTYSEPEELADAHLSMQECSSIFFDGNPKKYRNFYFFLDEYNDLIWRCKEWPDDVTIGAMTDFILQD